MLNFLKNFLFSKQKTNETPTAPYKIEAPATVIEASETIVTQSAVQEETKEIVNEEKVSEQKPKTVRKPRTKTVKTDTDTHILPEVRKPRLRRTK
jgi:hypothetical protein